MEEEVRLGDMTLGEREKCVWGFLAGTMDVGATTGRVEGWNWQQQTSEGFREGLGWGLGRIVWIIEEGWTYERFEIREETCVRGGGDGHDHRGLERRRRGGGGVVLLFGRERTESRKGLGLD